MGFGYVKQGRLILAIDSSIGIFLDKGGVHMSEIFDETNMKQVLGKYMPQGEALLAGIHAISKETNIRQVFGKCAYMEDRIVPDERGGIIALNKKKYSAYDIYIGITSSSLVIAGCEEHNYFYEFDDKPGMGERDIQEIVSDMLLSDIGTCFPLADIQSCEIKKGWMGSVKCFISMKNGTYFKLVFPKLGGLGGGMPRHEEYRDKIISCLSRGNA